MGKEEKITLLTIPLRYIHPLPYLNLKYALENLKIPRHVLEIRKRWYSSSSIGLKTRKGRGRTNEYSLDNKLVSVLVRKRLLFAISQLMIVTWSTIYYISPLPPFCPTTMPTDYTQWAKRGRSACDINLCRDPFIAVTISQNLIPIWIN